MRSKLQSIHEQEIIENGTDFKVLKKLGSGSFSSVFLAIDSNQQICAIKFFEKNPEKEIGALKACQSCPYVIKYIDFQQIAKTYFILIQECFTGPTLDESIGKITIPQLKNIARMMLLTLDAIHTAGYIHCDFKLQNILISSNFDDIRLIDFGCALKTSGNKPANNGTRIFRSPEQLLGYSNYNETADIWSFGLDIYFIVHRKSCYPWDASRALLQAANMSKTYGKEKIMQLLKDLHIKEHPDLISHLSNEITQPIDQILSLSGTDFDDDKLFDFLKSIFILDPRERPSAKDLLKHPFLNE